MTRLYLVWFGTVLCVIGYTVFAYLLQFSTPFIIEFSKVLLQILIAVSAVFLVLAILFKRRFKKEIVAWAFLNGISLCGFIAFLWYGWNPWFLLFMAVTFLGLMILGPYLHFE